MESKLKWKVKLKWDTLEYGGKVYSKQRNDYTVSKLSK